MAGYNVSKGFWAATMVGVGVKVGVGAEVGVYVAVDVRVGVGGCLVGFGRPVLGLSELLSELLTTIGRKI